MVTPVTPVTTPDPFVWTTGTAACRHLQMCRMHMYGNSYPRIATPAEMAKPVCQQCRESLPHLQRMSVDDMLTYLSPLAGTSRLKEMTS